MAELRNKYLLKNTLIFTLGNIGSKIISFFLIPLYTNILTTSQYGIVDLITTISTVASPMLTLNISESVMRFGLDKDSDNEKNIQIGSFIFCISAIIGLILIPFCLSLDNISNYSVYVYFYIFTLSASQLYLCDLRGKEMLLLYSIGNIVQALMVAFFNILFLVVLKLETNGYLLAYIFANTITATYALIVGKGYKSFRLKKLDVVKMKDMIRYSAVLIPNTFMWWIMNSSDRVMVTTMIGAAANGIYAVSYKVPTLISILSGIFNQAWSYSAIREEGTSDELKYHNRVFKSLISITMLLGIGLLTCIKPILGIYVGFAYYDAWKYTPYLIIGCVYLTLGTFIGTSYTVHKDSLGFLVSATFGALVNIVLNYLLIPVGGIYGAAVSTCVSYILVFIFRLFHTKKYISYNIKNKEFGFGSLILLASAMLIFVDNVVGQFLQISLCITAIIFYSTIWIPVFTKFIFKVHEKWRTR